MEEKTQVPPEEPAQQQATAEAGRPLGTSRPEEVLVADGRNARTVVCQRCGCCILLARKAVLIEKEVELPDEKVTWLWHLTNMYDFENIGFSKTTEQNIRYLTCADCERGVLGIQYLADPANIYLTTHRVKYQ